MGNPVRGVNTHKAGNEHGNTEQNRPGHRPQASDKDTEGKGQRQIGASGITEKRGAKSGLSRGRTVVCGGH